MHTKLQVFLNQPWWQMCASLILMFGKTKSLFGKDATRKKNCVFIRYLWKTKEKLADKSRGLCFSMKKEVEGHMQKLSSFGRVKNNTA